MNNFDYFFNEISYCDKLQKWMCGHTWQAPGRVLTIHVPSPNKNSKRPGGEVSLQLFSAQNGSGAYAAQ